MNVEQARAAGFTREVVATFRETELHLLIAPDTDLDAEFEAFDTGVLEMVSVKGFMASFEDVTDRGETSPFLVH